MIWNDFLPLKLFAVTPSGVKTLQKLGLDDCLIIPDNLQEEYPNLVSYHGSLKETVRSTWKTHNALIFCLSTGAVIRLIADLIDHKNTDPAIISIDPKGEFVISLLSGHQGKADQLTQIIAKQIQATPIITGTSHELNLMGIDILGLPYGWKKGAGDWLGVSAMIAKQYPVKIIQEVGSTFWQKSLPENHNFLIHTASSTESLENPSPKAQIFITATQREFPQNSNFPQSQWHPRVLWVGIGCERNTSLTVITEAIDKIFQKYHLAKEAIAGLATLDIKGDEPAILDYCKIHNYPLKLYSSEELKEVETPNPSEVVANEVGTPSVAEASAILACQDYPPLEEKDKHWQKICQFKNCSTGLLVSKQIYRKAEKKGAVTLAITQSPVEYTAQKGEIYLVGTGPGKLEHMTPSAQSAVTKADVVIGYGLYLSLLTPLKRAGQVLISLPLTKERERAERAVLYAKWGLSVAVVSSGDAGVYGMAGLVLEVLRQDVWDGQTPAVQVFPGISAVQAVASRLGAPLMQDFCTVSLSDLLIPWEVIEKRLEASAMGDFVVALYNPRSNNRTQHIITAQSIFLRYRHGNTPVALVRSVYREDEKIVLTTLDEMLNHPIDMLTTVLIGNSQTEYYHHWMITPRGYFPME